MPELHLPFLKLFLKATLTLDETTEPPAQSEQVLYLHEERISVDRAAKVTGTVKIAVRTTSHTQSVRETLSDSRVFVEHVPVGVMLDELPVERQEGNTRIIPIVEEIIEVKKHYFLREEIHVRQEIQTRVHEEEVTLRREEATISRSATETDTAVSAGTAKPDTGSKDHGQ